MEEQKTSLYTTSKDFRQIGLEVIIFLCMFLFVYAAISKLTDIEKFRVQIGQSPLLTPIALFTAWVVPIVEIGLALLLLFSKTRLVGLYGFFGMMVLFSAYILILLKFSPYLPCNCGGVLEKLSWNQHLLFNCIFIVLSIIAICIVSKGTFATISLFVAVSAGSVMIVYVLYAQYDAINSTPNGFNRKIKENVATQISELALPSNRYYFAGMNDTSIYLGNYDYKLRMLIASHSLRDTQDVRLTIKNMDRYKLTDIHLSVQAPYFYLWNGSRPVNFRGKLDDLIADRFMTNKSYFTRLKPLNENSFFITTLLDTVKGFVIGKESAFGGLIFEEGLLEKQRNAFFSMDGILDYDQTSQQLVYLYYYRNQFIVTDTSLNLSFRARTIDTNRFAKLREEQIQSENSTTLAAPPFEVNRNSAVANGFLYLLSNLVADNENRSRFRRSSVIDVYALDDGRYLSSFYLPVKLIDKIYVYKNVLAALSGKKLTVYELHDTVKQ